jgi:hypothetical protein
MRQIKEMSKLRIRVAAVSLRDVGHDRYGRPPKLVGEPIVPRKGRPCRKTIDLTRQFPRFLPYLYILEFLEGRHPLASTTN